MKIFPVEYPASFLAPSIADGIHVQLLIDQLKRCFSDASLALGFYEQTKSIPFPAYDPKEVEARALAIDAYILKESGVPASELRFQDEARYSKLKLQAQRELLEKLWADGQEFPQRDHDGELHPPHA